MRRDRLMEMLSDAANAANSTLQDEPTVEVGAHEAAEAFALLLKVLDHDATVQENLSLHDSDRGTPSFASRVDAFVKDAFTPAGAVCVEERTHRFVEEALELGQSTGCTAKEAHELVDYVFGRPVGERWQEAGGVMLTLCALCSAVGLDHEDCGERELERARGKIDVIRQKHLSKPRRSPLPGQAEETATMLAHHGLPAGSVLTGGAQEGEA